MEEVYVIWRQWQTWYPKAVFLIALANNIPIKINNSCKNWLNNSGTTTQWGYILYQLLYKYKIMGCQVH